ncbi:AVT1C [Symbiodinium sp. CCMP2592]|nr:AVT1C [Symbiodinium sp. CCMP2592]
MAEIASVVPELSPAPGPGTGDSAEGGVSKSEKKGRRPPLSTFKTYVNLVTVVIGAGIMALPQLPRRGGWVLSSLILVLVLLSSVESGLHMWKAFMASRGSFEMLTYGDLGREAWGPLGEILANLVINIFLFGVYSAYAVLIGMQLENISQQALDKRFWILILYPVFVALALAPNLSALSRLVPLGMLAACATAAFIVGKSLADASHWQTWDEEIHSAWPQESLMSLGVVLATCIGAVAFQPVVPSVLQDMGKPEKFPLAMLAAVVTCGCLYLAVMLCGYHGYGAFILQDIVQSMTHSPKDVQEAFEAEAWNWTGAKSLWVPALVSSLVLVNIVLSMPIIMMAVFYSVQESKALAPHVKPGSWANWVMRATLVTIAVVIAMCVPRFTLVFGFFCAVAGPAVGLAFPLLFSGAVLRRCGVAQSWWRHGLHGLIILLSILCMVAGIYTSVVDLVEGQ